MEKKKKNNLKEYLLYVIIIVVVILIRTFLVTPVMVDGSSMEPTLKDNDLMILNKINYKVNEMKRFDIVVIRRPDDRLIKRLIAFPGETVEVKDSKLYINGKEVDQPFLSKALKDIDFSVNEPLEENCYFVMGDNRRNSLDSRYFGCVNKKDILGTANLVLFPFSNFGTKK